MSWRTSATAVRARDIGRALGLNRIIAKWVEKGYEEDYDRSLTSCIRSGDVVWDVGANVGYYTTQFAALAGATGTVQAFEPSPSNFARLGKACANLGNVALHPFGLGDVACRVGFRQGDDPLGATSQIVTDASGEESVEVRVGDALVSDRAVPAPNVIKIDVEGFEPEVIRGLAAILASGVVRAVGVEVHFGILRDRNLPDAARAIESSLKQAGFVLRWPDRSHLLATR